MDADVVVVGAGLAGLVATCELADAGRSVVLLDQESEANLGGQAWWSFGGLFLVDSPEQRRMGISDSFDLAWQDWEGTAGWDRLTAPDGSPGPDHWGRQWGRAYVEWAAGEKRAWLARRDLVLPRRRLGRAWRRHQRRTRQLGAALPHPVGYRHRRRRAVRARGARAHRGRSGVLPAAPPGRPARAHQRGRHGRPRVGARAPTPRRAASRATATWSASSSTAARPSSSRRAASAGTTTWSGPTGPSGSAPARRPAHRGAGLRRRPDARHHRGGRRLGRQPRPDVALRRGRAQLEPRLAGPRHPHPARPELDVVRRAGQPAARALPSRASTPSARSTTCGTPVSTTPGSSSTGRLAGKEFALSGSEQNLDLTERRYRDVLRRPITKVTPSVKAFLDHGEDWLTAATIGELVGEDERPDPRRPARPRAHRAADRRARPPGRQPLHQGRPGRRDPGRRGATAATG